MPRHGNPLVYAVAERFVDSALRRDDSLFTPGRAIWSAPYLDELDARYVRNPDLGEGSFEEKLRGQLSGASPEAIQLVGEALFVYYLPAHHNIGGQTKRQKLAEVLGMSVSPVRIPPDLDQVLDHGIGSGGAGFHAYKWASLAFLLSFVRLWKQSSQSVRDEALSDPWRFRDLVAQVPTEGGGVFGRESLLHLVFPDTFERIFSRQDKFRLAGELKGLVDDPSANVDRRISQIRAHLSHRFGPDFDFYETDGARALWKRFERPLDEFIYWGARYHELPSFKAERDAKLEIVGRLTLARQALAEGREWFPVLERAFRTSNPLTQWVVHDTFLKWCQQDLDRGARLLRRLWESDDDPLTRLADFFVHLPHEAIAGLGSRTGLGSFLLLAVDPYTHPPYRVAPMHAAYRLAGFEPEGEKDEVAMYREGIKFLDMLRGRAAERGLALADRLDAQSIVTCLTSWPVPEEWPEEDRAAFEAYRSAKEVSEPPEESGELDSDEDSIVVVASVDPLIALAGDLLIEEAALREIAELLRAKGQVVFYGPPGTGKTYVARRLADALAGDPGRARLVQFHPSYAYEDFFEGFRPRKSEDGQAGFELVGGPLKTLAGRAAEDPGHDYYLVIDELNRGNIPKIFGELYFLLEYRDEEIELQYSPDRPFRLPPNLRLIATMNTADRSIALLDAALRRRFTFVPFFPDRQPIVGLLGRWLRRHRPEMSWVADVVDAANRKLADRNGAVGPSFFMVKELDEARLSRIWDHEILPYLEDYFFDTPERIEEFRLERLRKEVDASKAAPAAEAERVGDVQAMAVPGELTPAGGGGEQDDGAAAPTA